MAPRRIDIEALDFAALLRPGDGLTWGQASAEPAGLVRRLVAQRSRLGGLRAFVGLTLGDTLDPARDGTIAFASFGALGTARRLHAAGVLEVVPMNYSALPKAIGSGRLPCDAVLVQISPAGPDGRHSLGYCNDHLSHAIAAARLVIAEINPHVPWTRADRPLDMNAIDILVETDAPPFTLTPARPGPTEEAIGRHLAALIEDGATLQYGVGAVPGAMLRALGGHRDLGIHSGLLNEDLIDLVERGAITNARKQVLPGRTVGGVAIASERMRCFLHDNREIELHPVETTHGAATLGRLDRLVAVNSAIEVDLRGQINAEIAGGRYVGGIGGQADFMHAASQARHGVSVIAMPSTDPTSGASRIVPSLPAGCVTTCRAAVEVVVTEHGLADLRGLSEAARARRLIAIADPSHRDSLEAANPFRSPVSAGAGPAG